MAMIHVNNNNFEELVLKAEKPVLVDFWASWCGPCSMLSPILDQLAQEHPEVVVAKVNVDEAVDLAQEYQISAIPSLLLFKEGKPAGMSVGVKSKGELEAFIK